MLNGLISLIRLVSFFGMFVFIVRAVSALNKGKDAKPHAIGLATCFCLLIVCGIISPAKKPTSEPTRTDTSGEVAEESSPIEYTPVQEMFLSVNKNYTRDDAIEAVVGEGLVYTEREYTDSTVIKAAWTEDVARQSRGKMGESIEYHFDSDTGDLEYTEYSTGYFISGLDYNYGVYWDLRSQDPQNEYSGYYVNDLLSQDDGAVITYSNGNQKKTHYHKMDTKEDVLNFIIAECEKRKEAE